jgi:hypothetical protein
MSNPLHSPAAALVAGRFGRFAEIPKGEKAGRDERDPCVGAAYAPFPELQKLAHQRRRAKKKKLRPSAN